MSIFFNLPHIDKTFENKQKELAAKIDSQMDALQRSYAEVMYVINEVKDNRKPPTLLHTVREKVKTDTLFAFYTDACIMRGDYEEAYKVLSDHKKEGKFQFKWCKSCTNAAYAQWVHAITTEPIAEKEISDATDWLLDAANQNCDKRPLAQELLVFVFLSQDPQDKSGEADFYAKAACRRDAKKSDFLDLKNTKWFDTLKKKKQGIEERLDKLLSKYFFEE